MSAAYKSAMIQTFCIPFAGSEDPERTSHRVTSSKHVPEPVQGWEQWARDIEVIVGVCESEGAVELVQERNRQLLTALGRERSNLYQQIGTSVVARREALRNRAAPPMQRKRSARSAVSGKIRRTREPEKADA